MARKRYDDQFRASAVLLLEGQGYPNKPGALKSVAGHLAVSQRTLQRWWKGDSNPPPDNVVATTKKALEEELDNMVRLLIGVVVQNAEEASVRDAVVGIGVGIDKLQLLSGKPTERTEHMGEVVMQDARDKLTRKLDSYAARQDASGAADLLN